MARNERMCTLVVTAREAVGLIWKSEVTPVFATSQPIAERLRRWAAEFDAKYEKLITPIETAPGELVEAVRYSALAGGKRLRPFLVTRCCELTGGDALEALPAAAAIECVHTFSLVHDDLPAMDDDDLRRGRPTAHKQFGEAMAILSGDALLALAFELIVRGCPDGERAAAMVLELSRGTGWSGMIGGQVHDVLGEHQPPSRSLVETIHSKKTAALFASACRLGALVAGADAGDVERLGEFGRFLGHTFQIADDLLDLTATPEQMGKAVRKDAKAGKQTYPAVVGVEASRAVAAEMAQRAIDALSPFGDAADDLRSLAMFVVQRQH